MFSYISLEERVPAAHPLRKLRAVVDALLGEVFPRCASQLTHQIARRDVHEILVLPHLAEAVTERQMGEIPDHLLPLERRAVPRQIVARQTRTVA